MKSREVTIGSWSMNVGGERDIPQNALDYLSTFLTSVWRPAVMADVEVPWWSIRYQLHPSPLIRVDMAPVNVGGNVPAALYEVETRPAGLGVLLSLLPQKKALWQEVFAHCRGFVRTPESPIQDDQLCAEILGLPFFESIGEVNGHRPLWIRSDVLDEVEDISLVPIREDGDKRYLLRLGLAERISSRDLDFDQNFAIKPIRGARCTDVQIYLNSQTRKKFAGSATKSQIQRIISGREDQFLVQSFIAPEEINYQDKPSWLIWRIFFGWINGRYEPVGGLWVARRSLKIHGARDSICGPLAEV